MFSRFELVEGDYTTEAFAVMAVCERFGILPFGKPAWDDHSPAEQSLLRAYAVVAEQRERRARE